MSEQARLDRSVAKALHLRHIRAPHGCHLESFFAIAMGAKFDISIRTSDVRFRLLLAGRRWYVLVGQSVPGRQTKEFPAYTVETGVWLEI
jgi:hypothetical protein